MLLLLSKKTDSYKKMIAIFINIDFFQRKSYQQFVVWKKTTIFAVPNKKRIITI